MDDTYGFKLYVFWGLVKYANVHIFQVFWRWKTEWSQLNHVYKILGKAYWIYTMFHACYHQLNCIHVQVGHG